MKGVPHMCARVEPQKLLCKHPNRVARLGSERRQSETAFPCGTGSQGPSKSESASRLDLHDKMTVSEDKHRSAE